ncbi:MAG: hypothetical protein O7G84_01270 [Gammaproteobacteria bacterium]|nr:hypothetical protein [Gammaproteobacteria bacterium]
MALGAIPFVGPALQAAVQAAESLTDIAIGQAQAQASTAGVTGALGTAGGMRMAGLGLNRTQVTGRMAALAQASGMRGKNLAALGPEALRMQELTGINAGGMAGALGTAGGGQNPRQAMKLTEEAIAAGLNAGIREGKLPQFIAAIAANIESMRKQGIQVDPRGLPSLVRQLSKAGPSLQGAAAVTAAKGGVAAIKGAGKGGGFMDALALQVAMGTTDPETGKKLTAFQAELALEANPEKFIPLMMDRIGQMGGTDEGKAKLIQRWQGGSLAQAFDIARGATAGKFAGGPGAASAGAGAAFVNQEEAAQAGGRGLAGQVAAQQNRKIAAGKKISGQMMKVREQEIGMGIGGAKVGAAAAGLVSGAVGRYSDALTSNDPIGAVMGMFAEDMRSMFSGVFEDLSTQLGKTVKGAFGLDPESAGAELQKLLSTPEGREEGWKAITDILSKIFAWLQQLVVDVPFIGSPGGGPTLVAGE